MDMPIAAPVDHVHHTPMNTYDALMAAADHIEKFPQLYSFDTTRMVTTNRPIGCMLARIAHFAALDVRDADLVAPALFGMRAEPFFRLILAIIGSPPPHHHILAPLRDPTMVAPALRIFAKRYFKKDASQRLTFIGIPQEIQQIFNVEFNITSKDWSASETTASLTP